MSAPDLSALVSARLCHDLISPMGAIGNGLELMQLSQTAGSAELDLVAGSLGSALAKLRFYRLAFGPADAQGRLSLDEIRSVTEAMFSGRFAVAWGPGPADLPRGAVKLAFLALLCLEKSLPMGGTARVVVEGETMALAVEARRTAPPAELWDLVVRGAAPEALRPDGIQFALLRQELDAAGRAAEIAFAETGATLRMTAPEPLPA
ncbi:histidine phosphotransferase family protein [Amaricoccus sp.]|uniref:histidine phosphotransferase family protein n=1 Tax=Amaricoccus sp. TaxID=1872485 RepID=UPI001B446435|nr:histidine phosphotransferase family protein [Amaricoccus sp.]MBP7000244.1 histidine phosphotransferase [Amaricoccus sp.]